jgi:NAD(P)-dependent dehydrogenase (short-subunit alcohol dehydrogenase family)
LALTDHLSASGWQIVVDARNGRRLVQATQELAGRARVTPIDGDVSDAAHRRALVAAAERLGGLDLLVHNASALGASPLPALADHPLAALQHVYAVNVVAPLALTQAVLPLLRAAAAPTVVTMSSDAAVEAYAGWGGYGSSKAALDHLAAVLAVEAPWLRVYAFDPGDMRTALHQAAFPGEDISDRPPPRAVVPALAALLEQRPPSGRYRAADLVLQPADASTQEASA